MKKLLDSRTPMFYVELAACLVGLVCFIYYAIQATADEAFDAAFFVLMLLGVICVVAHVVVLFLNSLGILPFGSKLDLIFDILPFAAAVLMGISLGIIIMDMLPTMSDYWNGVNFVGGNLTAYIVYTVLTAVSAVAMIVTVFTGTAKKAQPAEAQA